MKLWKMLGVTVPARWVNLAKTAPRGDSAAEARRTESRTRADVADRSKNIEELRLCGRKRAWRRERGSAWRRARCRRGAGRGVGAEPGEGSRAVLQVLIHCCVSLS